MKSRKKINSWLVFFAGLGFVGWGASTSNPMHSSVLLSFGGAISGAALSQIVRIFDGFDFLSSISRTIHSNFRSEEEKINGNRIKFHHYHRTKMDGKDIWRYSVFDFSSSIDANLLSTRTPFINKDGNKTFYKVEAGFRDERFVLFIKSEDRDESSMIEVYPTMGKNIPTIHCGFALLESWDEDSLVTKCILKKSPFNGWTKLGTVDNNLAKGLESEWLKGMENHSITPLIDKVIS